MLARARALGLFGRLRVARLFPLIFVPLATGCTLWYLATDPFDGLGEGSGGDATSGEGGSLSDGGIPDEPPDCGALDTIANCGACGVACGGSGAQCLQSSVEGQPGGYQCSAVVVDTTAPPGFVSQAITVWNDRLYVLDTSGGVSVCAGTCDTDSFTQLAVGSGVGCYITASIKGLFWSTLGPDNVNHIDFDGGPRPKTAAVRPKVVTATGARVAWTSGGSGSVCDAFDTTSGELFFVANPAFGTTDAGPNISNAADLRNAAFIDDGGALAWTSDEQTLHVTTLFDDGGVGTIKDFEDAGPGNLIIGSNGQDLALTSESKTIAGDVYDLLGLDSGFSNQHTTKSGVNGAAVFFGNGLIYWSDTKTSISYCAPNPGHSCGAATTILHGISPASPLTQIVANSKHIFFTTGTSGSTLYRIDPPL
jgi:hypothetical protein